MKATARPLSPHERALLDALLAHDFPGIEALRVQARAVLATRGCDCGCGTLELVVPDAEAPRSIAANPVPVDGIVLADDGREIGGVILFVRDGLLDSLEVYSWGDDPLPLPTVDQVRWY